VLQGTCDVLWERGFDLTRCMFKRPQERLDFGTRRSPGKRLSIPPQALTACSGEPPRRSLPSAVEPRPPSFSGERALMGDEAGSGVKNTV
jgi:hypothetical protein